MKQFIEKNKLPIILVAILLVTIIVGVSLAYFSSKTEVIINRFSSGNVTIEVIEDDFDRESAETTAPNEVISKNPKVNNTGKNDAYVFIQVEIPRVETIKVGEDKVTLGPKIVQDLFTYTINANWLEIDSETLADVSIYTYAYTAGPLAVGDSTNSIFDNVQIISYLEGTLDTDENYIINIKGLAVQSENLRVEGDTIQEKMEYIYRTYLED